MKQFRISKRATVYTYVDADDPAAAERELAELEYDGEAYWKVAPFTSGRLIVDEIPRLVGTPPVIENDFFENAASS